MKQYFTTTVSLQRQSEDGILKKVSESYLVDAMTFTEAEARIAQVMETEGQQVTLIRSARSNYSEVIDSKKETYYKIKTCFMLLDDNGTKPKKTNYFLLVAADNLQQATEVTVQAMEGLGVPYEIEAVSKTKIIEVVK